MMKRWIASVLLLLLAGCDSVAAPPPVANLDGLSPEALSLAYVLDQGCLAYILDGKSEGEAMASAGLRRLANIPSWPMPSATNRLYGGRYPGRIRVSFERHTCSTLVDGGDATEARRAVDAVLKRRLGAQYDRRVIVRGTGLPGEDGLCWRGIVIIQYPRPKRLFPAKARSAESIGYEVDASPRDCAAIRQP